MEQNHNAEGRYTLNGENRELLNELITEKNCTDRELKILQMRFGLPDGEPHTLEETAQAFGITRERIRQIEDNVIRRISRTSRRRRKPIEDYYK